MRVSTSEGVLLWSHLEDMHHLGRQLWDQHSESGADVCVQLGVASAKLPEAVFEDLDHELG